MEERGGVRNWPLDHLTVQQEIRPLEEDQAIWQTPCSTGIPAHPSNGWAEVQWEYGYEGMTMKGCYY